MYKQLVWSGAMLVVTVVPEPCYPGYTGGTT